MTAPLLLLAASTTLTGADLARAQVQALVAEVQPVRIQATVEKLASFGTRHTLSDPSSGARGIGAARRWLAAEMASYARLPGSRLQPFEDRFVAEPQPRIPRAVEIVNVGAVLPGIDDARREALVVTGHYDSRATDVMDAASDAPGAVDDASGVALTLELARVLAAERPAVSIYFVAVAGEEQGLLGAAHLAGRLKAEGVQVLGMLAVDILGNTMGQNGVRDNVSARLFSEGVPSGESDGRRRLREAVGLENDSPSRELARYLKRTGEPYVENLDLWVMLRRDRIARGGDHLAFAREGFPSARLSEAWESYDRQHQTPRTEQGRRLGDTPEFFDAEYCAKATRAILAAFWHLSHAPSPPRELTLGGAVSGDTTLQVLLPDDPRIAGLVVYRRRADQVSWQRAERHPKTATVLLKDVVVDNGFFAVATIDSDGNESLPRAPTKLD